MCNCNSNNQNSIKIINGVEVNYKNILILAYYG